MLLIDSGNSSIKCRLIQNDTVQDCAFDLYRDGGWQQFESWLKTLEVARIYLASVASAEIRQRLRDLIARASNARLHPLKSLPELNGVKNAYEDYRQLGVDRWLAILGATEVAMSDAIVIDAGSAITIDLLSQSQGHLGGAILPGFHCDPERFEQIFPTIDFSALPDVPDDLPGHSTITCLRPALNPVSGEHIQQLVETWQPLLDESCEILLCGQDASRVSDELGRPHRLVPDLVFTGMLKQIACLG